MPPPFDQARWFADHVQPHEPVLRAYLRRRFPTLTDADDVVQESALKALSARQQGPMKSVKGFLFTVARNAAISLFRRQKFISHTPVSELADSCVLTDHADFVETVCSDEELVHITEAIGSLPDRCRQVATLRLLRGLDYATIATELGISEKTVRVQMARGMKKCSQYLRVRGILPDSP